MDKEKFDAVIGYFNDLGITLPTSVKNSIEDVFMENDDVSSVECYHLEDREQFQQDLTFNNSISLRLKKGHSGTINNVFTYYGEIEYSYSEDFNLYDSKGNIIENISKIDSNYDTTIMSKNDWVVTLTEVVEWDDENSDEVNRTTTLYIYCPESSEEFEYQSVYDEVKGS